MNTIRPNLPPVPVAPETATRASSPRRGPEAAPAEPATLWEILTPEERAFFEQRTALGPLVYGPARTAPESAPPAPTGQRIDVRG
jgi:hypothetical protein